jgi:methionyl-tRNA formyltransferase
MRFIVLGTTDFTLACASALIDCGAELAALVSMPEGARPDNAAPVGDFALSRGIDYHEISDLNAPQSVALLASYQTDYLVSTWPRIIGPEVLALPRYCTIGTHPTNLPHNRGRHPLHWLIALGLTESKLSFFRMDQGVDSGAILHQEPFQVAADDEIATLVQRVNRIAYQGMSALYQVLLREPDFPGTPQDESQASSWRKRTPHDSLIDPRLAVATIIGAVRCFAPPYPGASLIVNDQILRVAGASRTEPDPGQFPDTGRMEPGRVLAVGDSALTFKAADGCVTLTFQEPVPEALRRLKYLHPPSKYLCSFPELAARI